METWLPLFFAGAMGLALLIYVILDGYDLGIGLLLPLASDSEKDLMIASIGPFWDANETWIVLGIGILLIAFPQAHGEILTAMYIPVTLMLMGLVLRGIAFDFRAKAVSDKKEMWNLIFSFGSLITACSQGWMLGTYITGLAETGLSWLFSILIALTLPALYVLLGAAWLLIKTEGELFDKAMRWAARAILPMGVALLLVSIATPLVSQTIADKWFSYPNGLMLLPIPVLSTLTYGWMMFLLYRQHALREGREWLLFAGLIVLCLLAALGLAYSILPDIIIGQMTIWESAASTPSLLFTFWGTAIVLPAILGYTFFVYRIFRGKTSELTYE
ncbi:cytochrome d ubiquinol oxidase subunit II [Pseudohongiella sp. SYSU M77423]|uniref:cytochrome d ubiquinol oxidase subunit II n=1 Tax=Pseudohongiella sp. SYSU M77423 TaxID=3042312 RepID=UPI00247FEE5B|nr:cytochrome d ubiquinol oxidase subunit II [Pseudohongiella sp. SYSU M77423]MDH7944403.1 cytochrome d ubiquinol oxidase subunit II [Pseudohongiella sp. SYSU M77423]MEC8860714.1 cytochrome d ubiquinol oxidase subunit II [Pseudomonadota bacterium]